MQHALDFARANRERFVEQLKDFLRIPSISTLPEYAGAVREAANWLADEMTRMGLEHVQILETPGHPIVYGDWLHAGDNAPIVLVYGHYDVQPVDPIELWNSPPFEPDIRQDNIYARGATDDKGQVLLNLKALESMFAGEGHLPVNIKLVLEGEEEIGSIHLDQFIPAHKELLAADSVLISDSSFLTPDTPSIPYSVRGIAAAEVHVYGPKTDLHSGGYGGTVHNPAVAISEIIASLHDEQGRIRIPGFYDKVRVLSEEERNELSRVPYTLEDWQQATGLEHPWGDPDFTLIERTGVRPTVEVNGLWSGFQGEGSKTIIPAQAHAKFTMRLVPNQNPEEIMALFIDYINAIAPKDLRVEIVPDRDSCWAAVTPIDSPEMTAARQSMQSVWEAEPILVPGGGSIPVVATFQQELKVPVVLLGFGLPDSGIHAPNEFFSLDQFHKGIETIIRYYYSLVR